MAKQVRMAFITGLVMLAANPAWAAQQTQEATLFGIAADKRLSNRWQMLASYSATRVNNPVVFQTAGAMSSGDQRGFFSAALDPNAEIFGAQETWEWQARASGSYQLPFDIVASTSVTYQNGEPFGRLASLAGGRTIPSIQLRVEPIGAQHHPNLVLVQFRAEKGFRLRAGQRLSVAANVLNLLNANTVLTGNAFPYNPGQVVLSGSTYGQVTTIANPRVGEFVLKYTF